MPGALHRVGRGLTVSGGKLPPTPDFRGPELKVESSPCLLGRQGLPPPGGSWPSHRSSLPPASQYGHGPSSQQGQCQDPGVWVPSPGCRPSQVELPARDPTPRARLTLDLGLSSLRASRGLAQPQGSGWGPRGSPQSWSCGGRTGLTVCDGCSGGCTQQGVEARPECMRGCALHLDTCLVTRDTCPQHSPARTQALRGKGVVSVGAAWALGTRSSSPRLEGRSLKWAATWGTTLVVPHPSFHGQHPCRH